MAIKKKKVITIEGLALMIGEGFAQQDKRFEKIEGELGGVKKELGGVKDELGEVRGRLGKVEIEMGKVKDGLSSLQETNAMEHQEMKTHLNNMAYRFELNELGRRVSALEKKVK